MRAHRDEEWAPDSRVVTIAPLERDRAQQATELTGHGLRDRGCEQRHRSVELWSLGPSERLVREDLRRLQIDHVMLSHPVVRPTWDLYVPADKAFVLAPGVLSIVDIDWFYNQVRTQLSPGWSVDTFPIVLSHNVFFYIGDPSQCCVLGFHDAYIAGLNPVYNKFDAQTWAWASYSDPFFPGAPGISDVHALSHEVSEWLNDPFGFNAVPPWQGNDAYGCSPVLEVGDPIVGSDFPITMNGRTYHPQNEVLMQWFARESPSSAFGGAYSYPNTSVVTTLPNDCSF